MFPSYTTERLSLHISTADNDAAFILALLNSPKWIENIGDRNVHTIDDARHYISSRMTTHYNTYGYGNYIVHLAGEKIGACGIYRREGLDIPDIGFAFLPGFEGKGYGYEAASRLIRAAYNDFKLKELCAITMHSNIPSQKLLEKIGLRYQKEVTLPGDSTPLRYYYADLATLDLS